MENVATVLAVLALVYSVWTLRAVKRETAKTAAAWLQLEERAWWGNLTEAARAEWMARSGNVSVSEAYAAYRQHKGSPAGIQGIAP